MKTKMVKLKSVTVNELRVINENSIRAKLNVTYDIDELINYEMLSDTPDFAYSVQLLMAHPNQNGRIAISVCIGTNSGLDIIMQMTQKDYEGLFKRKFRVLA